MNYRKYFMNYRKYLRKITHDSADKREKENIKNHLRVIQYITNSCKTRAENGYDNVVFSLYDLLCYNHFRQINWYFIQQRLTTVHGLDVTYSDTDITISWN